MFKFFSDFAVNSGAGLDVTFAGFAFFGKDMAAKSPFADEFAGFGQLDSLGGPFVGL